MRVDTNVCQLAFSQAHEVVVQHLGGPKSVWFLDDCYTKLTAAWKELHGINIHWDNNNTELEFENGGEFLIFLLRWAG